MAAAEACAAMASHSVNFIYKDNARRMFLALDKQITDPRGSHADEHLDEIRARDGEERHARLARDGPREEGFAGSRRPHQQDALGDAAAEAGEALRIAQELDYLLEFLFSLVYAGYVGGGDLMGIFGEQRGAALPE